MAIHARDNRQEFVDRFYAKHGPCCAGCDFWRWISPLVGECIRFPPNQSHDAMKGLGFDFCSLPRSTANLTRRDHVCGEFRDQPPSETGT